MNIIMMTNTYKPILGGLEKSIEAFTKGYREKGHRVIIVAPEFENMRPEKDVIRLPAMQNVRGTDFSIQLPNPGVLTEALGDFKPDIIHSHHPFLVGDTAIRIASKYNVPLVFTHHTLYEQNTHYFPAGETEVVKRFVIQLATGYANLADKVFAPSESIMELLLERGVETPIEVVPTGIDTQRFSKTQDAKIRNSFGIPKGMFVVGHLGRLAPEKNLEFVSRAALSFLKKKKNAYFLVVGKGPSEDILKEMFEEENLSSRLILTGALTGPKLVEAYHAMDVFVFASQSETQGLVLAEAMAAAIPVVAVDAPGVREVVKDKCNGRLLMEEKLDSFVSALDWVWSRNPEELRKIKRECRKTAQHFAIEKSIEKALALYFSLVMNKEFNRKSSEDSAWDKVWRLAQAHWNLTKNLTKATTGAILGSSQKEKEV